MSPKKAAKKVAKKAAKKVAAKHADPKHHERKDLRRAYEHLGRVEILQRVVSEAASGDVHTLVALAERELNKGHRKEAAELLRAAEHFSFAAAGVSTSKAGKVSDELQSVVYEEIDHLTRKAKEHWEHSDDTQHHASVKALFQRALGAAVKAHEDGAYRQALELARGAEALAHVTKHGPDELSGPASRPKLPKP